MTWKSKAAAVVGLAAGILLLYAVLAPPSVAPLAFAAVAEKLRDAQTLSFDQAITLADGTTHKSRSYYMVPGKVRQESSFGGREEFGVLVLDFAAGKTLIVSPKVKTAIVGSIKGKLKDDFAGRVIDDIRSLDEKDARSLGEQEIDGVRAKGFETDTAIRKTTVWADTKTGDPLRIETVWKNAPGGPAKDVMTHFKLDEKLDPAMFSLEPPAGYKIMSAAALDVDATPAEQVAGLLKTYARLMDGEFPARLQDAAKAVAEKLKPKADEPPSEDVLQIASYGGAVGAITLLKKEGKDWQYFDDVKLGQKDRIVFWYQDAKKKTYQAVYGDLRVEKVDRSQLPKPDAGP